MIDSKKKLHEYLAADKSALGRAGRFPSFFDYIWRFTIALRKCEYYTNCRRDPLGKIFRKYYQYRKFRLGMKCGFTIPVNVFGKGLAIVHTGTIVVSPFVRVGENCRIHVCVNIGGHHGEGYPKLGDRIYIGPGAKIFGNITIADDIAIGANAVVNKSFATPGISIGGIPAAKISDRGSTHCKQNG